MDKILTIVVAAYNVEAYIEKCLNSFIIQNNFDMLEVLVINDGSKDHTADIVEQYVQKYPNVYRLITKQNGGHGSAVNRGIKEAKGKYFKIVDGDDWVNSNNFNEFVKLLMEVESDMILSDYNIYNMKTDKTELIEANSNSENNREYKYSDICNNFEVKMHCFCIKTSILQVNNIVLDPRYYVDVELVVFPLIYVNTVTFFKLPVYMYRVGLPNQSISRVGWQKNILEHEKMTYRIIDFLLNIDSSSVDKEIYSYIKNRVMQSITGHIKLYTHFTLNYPNARRELLKFKSSIAPVYSDWYRINKDKVVKLLINTDFITLKLFQSIYSVYYILFLKNK